MNLRDVLFASFAFLCCGAAAGLAARGPCDIYATGGTPCVAAYSVARALYGSYDGALYAVNRSSDGEVLDVHVAAPGGFADAAAQDAFCASADCTMLRIYDQSPRGNDLAIAPGGGTRLPFDKRSKADRGCNASAAPLKAGGAGAERAVYAARFDEGMGYRNDTTSGVATGDQPETMYMVVDGRHYNSACCFDFGNAETDRRDHGGGTMEAVYFGSSAGSLSHPGSGKGPWVMADLENGVWAGNGTTPAGNAGNTPVEAEFAVAMAKGNGGAGFALKGGDAQAGGLRTLYDGARPRRYGKTMKLQGGIILGIGGDNSHGAVGTFIEGAMTAGYATDEVDDQIYANIAAVQYRR